MRIRTILSLERASSLREFETRLVLFLRFAVGSFPSVGLVLGSSCFAFSLSLGFSLRLSSRNGLVVISLSFVLLCLSLL